MTENDNTDDQLADSMQRTRAGIAKKATAAKKKVSAAPARRTSPGNPEAAAKPAAVQPAASRPAANADPYQPFDRVWPD